MNHPLTHSQLLESPGARRDIAGALVAWFTGAKRDLPWRGASPYAVWVSEIMLQQTQVATVIPYFTRFMDRFPTVTALADAPLDDVLAHWAGLGYYARARNLHRAARMVADRYHGAVPSTPQEIESLPGIGRYTSGAILSIAFGVKRPLVDANVVRVLTRLVGLHGDPKSVANQAALWALAEALVPEENPGDFNQALMELGALVCQPAEPRCEGCPLLTWCVAGNSPDPSALPEFASARATVTLVHVSAIPLRRGDEVLLIQRPPHGLWGGLWEFPRVCCVPGEDPKTAAPRAASEAAGLTVTVGAHVGTVRHTVTHHKITLHGFLATPASTPPECPSASARWTPIASLPQYPCASPQTLLREALLKHLGAPQHELPFE